jgi:ABC-2 type transport system permease protein
MNSIYIKNIFHFILILVALITINLITASYYFRFDMTSEKRYTLKPVTKEILTNLQDIVYIEVYLDGQLPIGFKKLQKAIRDQLYEYRVYAGKNLHFEWVNPMAEENEELRQRYITDLVKRGLTPTNIVSSDDEGGTGQKLAFPGAIIRYKGYEITVNLLKNNKQLSAEQNMLQTIESLEFEFISAIYNLIAEKTERVAFIEGHGELNEYETGDISREIARFYQVDRGNLTDVNCLDAYKLVIVAGGHKKWHEKEKFIIDQYIMNGGKVIWFIDGVHVDMDSLAFGSSVALINDINLTDQLFKYGVRIKPFLIQDFNCNVIPVNTATPPAQPQFKPVPWLYYPLLAPPSNHLITKGIDLVKSEFISPIDTLEVEQVRKTVLLHSSNYTKLVSAPSIVDLSEVAAKIDENEFKQQFVPVAVMLEGVFSSAFANRMINDFVDKQPYQFVSESKQTKLLLVADASIIKNEVKYTARGPMISALGFDRYTQQTFGNKDFIINAIHYLTDEAGLMQLKAKNYKLRLLDKKKVKTFKELIYLSNIVLPVILIILTSIIIQYYRKKKYAKP